MKVFILAAIVAFACQANAVVKSAREALQDPGVVCNDCKVLFGDIKNLIQSDQTKNTTTTAVLSLVCGDPGNAVFYGFCSNIVTSLVPGAIQSIANLIDPTTVCISFSLCPPPNGVNQALKFEPVVASAIMKKMNALLKHC